jgi:hypothetical protein
MYTETIYCAVVGNEVLCPECADRRGVATKYEKFESTVKNHEWWFCDECGVQMDVDHD